jgi:hypothetical protein
MRCVLSPGWSSETEPALQNTQAIDLCCQVFWEKTRAMSGYTIYILQQYNAIYQHFSFLLGINVFTGALIPFGIFLFSFIIANSGFSS